MSSCMKYLIVPHLLEVSSTLKDFQQFFKLLDIKSRISCIILVNEYSSGSAIDECKGFNNFIFSFPVYLYRNR